MIAFVRIIVSLLTKRQLKLLTYPSMRPCPEPLSLRLTALSVLALLLFGGETLYGFSLAFLIGIVIGTYSSIYIAGSLAVIFGFNSQSLLTFKQKYQGELDDYS